MVFTEYEQIPKKKANGIFSTATLPENAERSRIRDVVPYEENRVELIPTKENNTGYINASHIKVSRVACREGVLTDGWVKGQNAGREKCRSGCPCASWLVPRPQGNGFWTSGIFFKSTGRACLSLRREGGLSSFRENQVNSCQSLLMTADLTFSSLWGLALSQTLPGKAEDCPFRFVMRGGGR